MLYGRSFLCFHIRRLDGFGFIKRSQLKLPQFFNYCWINLGLN